MVLLEAWELRAAIFQMTFWLMKGHFVAHMLFSRPGPYGSGGNQNLTRSGTYNNTHRNKNFFNRLYKKSSRAMVIIFCINDHLDLREFRPY